jgi:hypothetical protein
MQQADDSFPALLAREKNFDRGTAKDRQIRISNIEGPTVGEMEA